MEENTYYIYCGTCTMILSIFSKSDMTRVNRITASVSVQTLQSIHFGRSPLPIIHSSRSINPRLRQSSTAHGTTLHFVSTYNIPYDYSAFFPIVSKRHFRLHLRSSVQPIRSYNTSRLAAHQSCWMGSRYSSVISRRQTCHSRGLRLILPRRDGVCYRWNPPNTGGMYRYVPSHTSADELQQPHQSSTEGRHPFAPQSTLTLADLMSYRDKDDDGNVIMDVDLLPDITLDDLPPAWQRLLRAFSYVTNLMLEAGPSYRHQPMFDYLLRVLDIMNIPRLMPHAQECTFHPLSINPSNAYRLNSKRQGTWTGNFYGWRDKRIISPKAEPFGLCQRLLARMKVFDLRKETNWTIVGCKSEEGRVARERETLWTIWTEWKSGVELGLKCAIAEGSESQLKIIVGSGQNGDDLFARPGDRLKIKSTLKFWKRALVPCVTVSHWDMFRGRRLPGADALGY